ncbi:MAG: hypothetical protein N2654_05540 [Deltaproteobacteria bacterium]|nr:hypothetical protein [Deltaproteobacteria bacterium]
MMPGRVTYSASQPLVTIKHDICTDAEIESIIRANIDIAINPNLTLLAGLLDQSDSPGRRMAIAYGLETKDHLDYLVTLSVQCIKIMNLHAEIFYTNNPHFIQPIQSVGLTPHGIFPFVPPDGVREIELVELPPFGCCVFDETKSGEYRMGVRTFRNRFGIIDRFGAYWSLATPARYHGPSPEDIEQEHPDKKLKLIPNGYSYVEWDIALPNCISDWEDFREFRLDLSDPRACILGFSLLVGPSRYARFPHINNIVLKDEKGRCISWIDTNAIRVDRMKRSQDTKKIE